MRKYDVHAGMTGILDPWWALVVKVSCALTLKAGNLEKKPPLGAGSAIFSLSLRRVLFRDIGKFPGSKLRIRCVRRSLAEGSTYVYPEGWASDVRPASIATGSFFSLANRWSLELKIAIAILRLLRERKKTSRWVASSF